MKVETKKHAALRLVVILMLVSSALGQLPASGTLDFSELLGEPATVTIRQVLINPDSVLGWHSHPGIGAYTVVKTGTLTIEDGCGGETTYTAGQAFVEPAGRIHRGKNLSLDVQVQTFQTIVAPVGVAISMPFPAGGCGVPLSADECKLDGWDKFTFPTEFRNQGHCEMFVMTGKW